MAQQFGDERYWRRQLVENRFSFLKRKFSGDLRAKGYPILMKEIANKIIVCNLESECVGISIQRSFTD
jgi:hypothetical protein